MRARSVFLALLLLGVSSIGGCYARVRGRTAVVAQVDVVPAEVVVTSAPPPLQAQVEVVPARPAPDAEWVPGHYEWRGGWQWVPGHWEAQRVGYVWVAPVARPGGRGVVYHPGYWRRANASPPAVYVQPGTLLVSAPPQVEVRPARPVVEVRPARPVVEVRPARPVVEVRPARPVVEVRPAAPVVEVRPARPAPPPVVEVRPARPVVEVRPARPAPPPVVEVRPARPVVEVRPAAPVVEVRPARPAPPGVEVRPARPAPPSVEVRPAQPTGSATVRPVDPRGRGPHRADGTVPVVPGPATPQTPSTAVSPGQPAVAIRPGQATTAVRPGAPDMQVRPATPAGTATVRPGVRIDTAPAPRVEAQLAPMSCRVNTARAPAGGMITVTGSFGAAARVEVAGQTGVVVNRRAGEMRVRMPGTPGGGAVRVVDGDRSADCGQVSIGN